MVFSGGFRVGVLGGGEDTLGAGPPPRGGMVLHVLGGQTTDLRPPRPAPRKQDGAACPWGGVSPPRMMQIAVCPRLRCWEMQEMYPLPS